MRLLAKRAVSSIEDTQKAGACSSHAQPLTPNLMSFAYPFAARQSTDGRFFHTATGTSVFDMMKSMDKDGILPVDFSVRKVYSHLAHSRVRHAARMDPIVEEEAMDTDAPEHTASVDMNVLQRTRRTARNAPADRVSSSVCKYPSRLEGSLVSASVSDAMLTNIWVGCHLNCRSSGAQQRRRQVGFRDGGDGLVYGDDGAEPHQALRVPDGARVRETDVTLASVDANVQATATATQRRPGGATEGAR